VAFDGCTLPGAAEPLFSVPADRMSLGLGIHGEPGISDHDLPSASELAELLVSRLLAERPAGAGNRVVPIVNGLGTVKYDELFLLFGKIETLLQNAGLEVVEPECGELVTSLNMSGLSLTLFWVDDELLELWTAPADTPAFRRGNTTARAQRTFEHSAPDEATATPPATDAATRLGSGALTLLRAAQAVVLEHEQDWGHLDAIAGDGDHGIGMRRGVDAAAQAAAVAVQAGAGVDRVLGQAGEAWAEKAGGTSGALWGAALCAAGRSLGDREGYATADALDAVESFSSAIIELGKAELGDKTMVDALLPYVAAFTAESRAGASIVDALTAAAAAAETAAADTAALSPRRGRARPLAERSIGHPDPGAVSFGLIAAGVARAHAALATPDTSTTDTAAPTAEDVSA
jgi:dihydroxyacetone kinase